MTHRMIRIAVRALALPALLVLLAPSARAEDEDVERETRSHDVSDLAPERSAAMRRVFGEAGLFTTWTSGYTPSETMVDLDERSVSQLFETSELASLLSAIVADIDEDADVEALDRRIRVVATPEAQRLVAAALDVVRRAAGDPVRVEVEELVLPPDVDVSGLPDAATLDAWRSHDVRGAGRVLGLALEPGCWRLAEDVRGLRCVVDVDVEIAQDAAIADPVVARVDTGVRVVALASPLLDGRVALRICASAADLRATPRRVALAEDELGSVDLADIEASFVCTELVLTAGERQTVVLDRPGGARRVLVFRMPEAPLREIGGTLRVFPYSALSRNAPTVRLTVGDQPWMDGRNSLSVEAQDGPEAWRVTSDDVRSLLEQEIVDDLDEGTAEISTIDWLLGGALAVRGSESALDRVASRLRALEASAMRHARLDVQIVERRPGTTEGRVVGRVTSPVPLGIPVALAAYRSAAFVADIDVEVAEKSQISDPLIGSQIAGIVANVVVSEAGHGAHVAALEMRVSAFDEPELHPFAATDVGAMERTRDRTLFTESRVRVTAARPGEVLLGQSPFTDEPAWLIAVVTVE